MMMTANALPCVLQALEISQAEMSRSTGLSKAAVNRLVVSAVWPSRNEKKAREAVSNFLKSKGAKPAQIQRILNVKAALATATNSVKAIPNDSTNNSVKQSMEDSMLLECTPITQAALKNFELPRSPFVDDVQDLEDVFKNKEIRYISACLEDAARNHGFCAITGESGSGKSTLLEALEEKLKANEDMVIVKPYVLAMERDDVKGKTLKSYQIVEAIATTIDPDVQLKRSPQARFKQVHEMLKDSRRAGRRHLLVIEEAHCLPIATLKHLKRFQELKDGLKRLIGIALIGQPELKQRLSSHNPEVREVMQRCEVITLSPLDGELQEYLKFKFTRIGARYEDVFAPNAVDAIRARLSTIPRGGRAKDMVSLCYPLVVNNLVARAMNAAALTGFNQINGDIIASC